MILIDEYNEYESTENNPDGLYVFDRHYHLNRTSNKMFGSVKTVEDVLSCISVLHTNLMVKLVRAVLIVFCG